VISAAEDVPAFFHEYAPRESLPGYAVGFDDCAQMFVSPSKRAEQSRQMCKRKSHVGGR
jgi:hypothetical protein